MTRFIIPVFAVLGALAPLAASIGGDPQEDPVLASAPVVQDDDEEVLEDLRAKRNQLETVRRELEQRLRQQQELEEVETERMHTDLRDLRAEVAELIREQDGRIIQLTEQQQRYRPASAKWQVLEDQKEQAQQMAEAQRALAEQRVLAEDRARLEAELEALRSRVVLDPGDEAARAELEARMRAFAEERRALAEVRVVEAQERAQLLAEAQRAQARERAAALEEVARRTRAEAESWSQELGAQRAAQAAHARAQAEQNRTQLEARAAQVRAEALHQVQVGRSQAQAIAQELAQSQKFEAARVRELALGARARAETELRALEAARALAPRDGRNCSPGRRATQDRAVSRAISTGGPGGGAVILPGPGEGQRGPLRVTIEGMEAGPKHIEFRIDDLEGGRVQHIDDVLEVSGAGEEPGAGFWFFGDDEDSPAQVWVGATGDDGRRQAWISGEDDERRVLFGEWGGEQADLFAPDCDCEEDCDCDPRAFWTEVGEDGPELFLFDGEDLEELEWTIQDVEYDLEDYLMDLEDELQDAEFEYEDTVADLEWELRDAELELEDYLRDLEFELQDAEFEYRDFLEELEWEQRDAELEMEDQLRELELELKDAQLELEDYLMEVEYGLEHELEELDWECEDAGRELKGTLAELAWELEGGEFEIDDLLLELEGVIEGTECELDGRLADLECAFEDAHGDYDRFLSEFEAGSEEWERAFTSYSEDLDEYEELQFEEALRGFEEAALELDDLERFIEVHGLEGFEGDGCGAACSGDCGDCGGCEGEDGDEALEFWTSIATQGAGDARPRITGVRREPIGLDGRGRFVTGLAVGDEQGIQREIHLEGERIEIRVGDEIVEVSGHPLTIRSAPPAPHPIAVSAPAAAGSRRAALVAPRAPVAPTAPTGPRGARGPRGAPGPRGVPAPRTPAVAVPHPPASPGTAEAELLNELSGLVHEMRGEVLSLREAVDDLRRQVEKLKTRDR